MNCQNNLGIARLFWQLPGLVAVPESKYGTRQKNPGKG